MQGLSSPLPTEGAGAIQLAPEDRVLGRYHLHFLIAQGGMASVYLAQLASEGGFSRWVAVKVVHPHLARNGRFVRMLLDEARITSRVQHPNVCSVLDFGRQDQTCYLVMEYLHGESFATVMKRGWRSGGVPWEIACRIAADAAMGLHAAHELRDERHAPLNVVHRDVSPQNVMVLYDGVTKVLDFGVAHARGKLEKTDTGEVKGKLAYMAPEQILGERFDRRADVWSLSVVLWEALAGRRLFRGANDGASVQRVMNADIPSLCDLRADVPAAVDALIQEGLQREPRRRVASASLFAARLEEALHSAGARAGSHEVQRWLGELFADRRAMRESMLREGGQTIPEIELESSASPVVELPTVIEQAPPLTPSSPPPARRSWLPFLLVMLVSLAAGALGTVALRGDGSAPARVADAASGPSSLSRPESVSSPPAPQPPEPSAEEERPSLPVEPPASAPALDPASLASVEPERAPGLGRRRERERATGTLNLLAVPPARVYERGRLLGETPLLGRELSAGAHRLELRPVGGGDAREVRVVIRAGELTRESVR